MENDKKVILEKKHKLVSQTSDISITSQETDASSVHSSCQSLDFSDIQEIQENNSYIQEVYASNLKTELKKIKSIIDKREYTFIGMDTEFPGTVYNIDNISHDFYYKTLKLNVDSTKIIQLGITLSNKKGEFPQDYPYHTWQFNFKFDLEKDKYSEESINLLKSNGINFETLKKDGIDHKTFAKCLFNSALVLNPAVKWVSYQGSYDFAYLLKILLNDNLPEDEKQYIDTLKLYFPEFYDVRMLIRDNEFYFHGGLNKLISNLKIERKGINHQAGSDAIATIEAYHKLVENKSIDKEKKRRFRNVLYGIGIGRDNENTIKYLKDANKNLFMNGNFMNNAILIYMLKQKQLMQNMGNYMQNNYGKCFYPSNYINNYEMIKQNMIMNQMKSAQEIEA